MAVKFPLIMPGYVRVGTLEELRENFDLAAVLGYYNDGKLIRWLEVRYYDEEAKKISELNANVPDFNARLCEILGTEYSEKMNSGINMEVISEKNERMRKLKQYIDDDEILHSDNIAFSQTDLADILDQVDIFDVIYLVGSDDVCFAVGLKDKITYKGINNPVIYIMDDSLIEDGVYHHEDAGSDFIIQDAQVIMDSSEMMKIWKEAAGKDNAPAMFEVGSCYKWGICVKESEIEAFNWYLKAAEQYMKVAEQGYSWGQYHLAEMYYYGYGVEEDDDKAFEWFMKSAEQGNACAQNMVGICYSHGNGVEINESEALKWVTKSAENGYVWGQHNLADTYCYGDGVEQDYDKAFEWFMKAALQGLDVAQSSLGSFYEEGIGAEQNYDEALKWYLKAAEQGYASAQYKVAQYYDENGNAETNLEEAAKWYIKAFENSNSESYANERCKEACRRLGQLLLNFVKEKIYSELIDPIYRVLLKGTQIGVYSRSEINDMFNRNFHKKTFIFDTIPKSCIESAESGYAFAQYLVGKICDTIYGEHSSESMKWFNRAAENGEKYAIAWIDYNLYDEINDEII